MSGAYAQATLTLNLAPTRGNKSSRWREETPPWMPPLLEGPRAPTRYRASESSNRLTLCHSQWPGGDTPKKTFYLRLLQTQQGISKGPLGT